MNGPTTPMASSLSISRDARDARYGLLRGYFHGADDDTVEELQQARLHSVTLPAAVPSLGRPLADHALHAIGVQVVSVRRATGQVQAADEQMVLAAGDTLVLSGLPEALALAEAKLLRA